MKTSKDSNSLAEKFPAEDLFPTEWTISSATKAALAKSPNLSLAEKEKVMPLSLVNAVVAESAKTQKGTVLEQVKDVTPFNCRSAAPFPTMHKFKVLLCGQGDVVQQRYVPALLRLMQEGKCHEVAFVGTEPRCLFPQFARAYFQVGPGGSLPLEQIKRAGFLDEETIGIVATPARTHSKIALELTAHIDVAIEKPLGHRLEDVTKFEAPANRRAFYIDHKTFGHTFQQELAWYSANPRALDKVAFIEGSFFETEGFIPERTVEDTTFDCLVHLFGGAVALLKTSGVPFGIHVQEVQAAQHDPDFERRWLTPILPTAVMACGRVIRLNAPPVHFRLMQAKCAPRMHKSIVLYDSSGMPIRTIDLSESGWASHYRALHSLLRTPDKLPLSLEDGIQITRLLQVSRNLACSWASYPVHSWPLFLLPFAGGSAKALAA